MASSILRTIDQQLEYLLKGAVEVIERDELRRKLERSAEAGRPLRVKVGFDPTAPDLHLGHTVILRKMRHFQDLGHIVYFLIGDFTGMIGDPSGRSRTRPALSRAEVEANAETYKRQVFKILDPKKTEIAFNSAWLGRLSAEQLVRLCSRYTVARMLERDDFARRLASGVPIAIHELIYPLLQAYDSVALQADVELGGTDQKFNLLVGRDIMREYGLEPQVIITLPLLEGLDGVEKMSKSLGNYIGVDEPPDTIYGKAMSISDELMFRYYELLTDLSPAEIEQLRRDVRAGRAHPMEVKARLAWRLVADFHSREAADRAAANFEKIFRQRQLPDEVPEYQARFSPELTLADLIAASGLAPSKTEARRLIKQGGVYIDGERVTDPARRARDLPRRFLLRCGRLGFRRIALVD